MNDRTDTSTYGQDPAGLEFCRKIRRMLAEQVREALPDVNAADAYSIAHVADVITQHLPLASSGTFYVF